MTRSLDPRSDQTDAVREIDLGAIGAALARRRRTIGFVTLAAFLLVAIFVNVVTPRYTAETQVLLENQETFFTRPDRVNLPPEMASQFDPEAVASQVQLINSRDLARHAIKELKLEGDPEFDPQARGLGPLKRVLVLLGLARDPTQESVDQRIVTAFLDKLTVFSPPKTRVITIQFTSRDAELAAHGANEVAALYLKEQSAAKRMTAKASADALAAQIADLRVKLTSADSAREQYRLQSGLLAGTNNMTISGQQLADINTDLSKARTSQADAQAKASMIRELLKSGKAADVSEVINNETVRRISEQRVNAEAQLALEARTLLPAHPRIKALTAQVAEYDLALKAAAKQAATTLENEAKIAGTRVVNLETVLSQQKQVAGVANVDEVHLHALERTAQGYKDQLESSTTKYQEALARQSSTATPADARVISSAVQPQEPSFPKKLPFIAFGTVAALVFSIGFIVAGELMSGRAIVEGRPLAAPIESDDDEHSFVPVATARGSIRRSEPETPADVSTGHPDDLVFAPVETQARRKATLFGPFGGLFDGGMMKALVGYITTFGESAASSRSPDEAVPRKHRDPVDGFGWDMDPSDSTRTDGFTPESDIVAQADELGSLAERIVAAHVPGRGVHIVGTSLGADSATTTILIDLGRTLADKGRSIVVDLNRSPAKLSSLVQGDGDGRAKIMGLVGLSELLAGDASFAEVIHRDHASRLHFIPTGRQEADFRDFDLILDALSETYDFVVMLTPAFPQSEIAKIMAPYADFVILATASEPDHKMLAILETELIEAGARAVLVAGVPPRRSRDARDVA